MKMIILKDNGIVVLKILLLSCLFSFFTFLKAIIVHYNQTYYHLYPFQSIIVKVLHLLKGSLFSFHNLIIISLLNLSLLFIIMITTIEKQILSIIDCNNLLYFKMHQPRVIRSSFVLFIINLLEMKAILVVLILSVVFSLQCTEEGYRAYLSEYSFKAGNAEDEYVRYY